MIWFSSSAAVPSILPCLISRKKTKIKNVPINVSIKRASKNEVLGSIPDAGIKRQRYRSTSKPTENEYRTGTVGTKCHINMVRISDILWRMEPVRKIWILRTAFEWIQTVPPQSEQPEDRKTEDGRPKTDLRNNLLPNRYKVFSLCVNVFSYLWKNSNCYSLMCFSYHLKRFVCERIYFKVFRKKFNIKYKRTKGIYKYG